VCVCVCVYLGKFAPFNLSKNNINSIHCCLRFLTFVIYLSLCAGLALIKIIKIIFFKRLQRKIESISKQKNFGF
jgi:hypothetical protein